MSDTPEFLPFSASVKNSFTVAFEQATLLNQRSAGVEVLLLGLLGEKTNIISQLLTPQNIDFATVRLELERTLAAHSDGTTPQGLTSATAQALELAQVIARQLHQPAIEAEHLLLGLLLIPKGIAPFITHMGGNPEQLRLELQQRCLIDDSLLSSIERTIPSSHQRTPVLDSEQIIQRTETLKQAWVSRPDRAHMVGALDEIATIVKTLQRTAPSGGHYTTQFTGNAVQTIMRASQEAQQHNHHTIETEHMLLALLRQAEEGTAQTLRTLHPDIAYLRQEVETRMAAVVATPQQKGLSPAAGHVINQAVALSARFEHEGIGTGHLLLGLVQEEGTIASETLKNAGIDQNQIERVFQEKQMFD